MTTVTKSLRDGFISGGAILVLMMALPLVLLLFFTLRIVLIVVGAVALLGGAVAYTFSPRARACFEAQVG